MGVAIITEAADLEEAAARLSDDVVVFDQRGCLSPRLALVVGDASRARELGERLHGSLSDWEAQVPRGALSQDEAREGARYEETLRFAGRAFRGEAHVVGVAEEGTALLVPPTGRHVHVMGASSLGAAREALAPIQNLIVAIGTDADLPGGRARVSPLGKMQKPPFDGPVDLRG